MLGYVAPNNDVFIFFENNEIGLLAEEKINGFFINFRNPDLIVPLEVMVDNEINDRIKTDCKRDDDGNFLQYSLRVRQRDYNQFKERRVYGLHEGYRHVNLIDINKMDSFDESNFRQLCHYRDKHLRLKKFKSTQSK